MCYNGVEVKKQQQQLQYVAPFSLSTPFKQATGRDRFRWLKVVVVAGLPNSQIVGKMYLVLCQQYTLKNPSPLLSLLLMSSCLFCNFRASSHLQLKWAIIFNRSNTSWNCKVRAVFKWCLPSSRWVFARCIVGTAYQRPRSQGQWDIWGIHMKYQWGLLENKHMIEATNLTS